MRHSIQSTTVQFGPADGSALAAVSRTRILEVEATILMGRRSTPWRLGVLPWIFALAVAAALAVAPRALATDSASDAFATFDTRYQAALQNYRSIENGSGANDASELKALLDAVTSKRDNLNSIAHAIADHQSGIDSATRRVEFALHEVESVVREVERLNRLFEDQAGVLNREKEQLEREISSYNSCCARTYTIPDEQGAFDAANREYDRLDNWQARLISDIDQLNETVYKQIEETIVLFQTKQDEHLQAQTELGELQQEQESAASEFESLMSEAVAALDEFSAASAPRPANRRSPQPSGAKRPTSGGPVTPQFGIKNPDLSRPPPVIQGDTGHDALDQLKIAAGQGEAAKKAPRSDSASDVLRTPFDDRRVSQDPEQPLDVPDVVGRQTGGDPELPAPGEFRSMAGLLRDRETLTAGVEEQQQFQRDLAGLPRTPEVLQSIALSRIAEEKVQQKRVYVDYVIRLKGGTTPRGNNPPPAKPSEGNQHPTPEGGEHVNPK